MKMQIIQKILSLNIPTVIALNMMDEVRNNGGTIDVNKMSEALGIPVVPISAIKNQGIDELIEKATETVKNNARPKVLDFCSSGPVHRCIHAVCHIIEDHAEKLELSRRFCATKLIEGDEDITKRLELNKNELELIEHSVLEMETESGLDRNALIADMRYTFIENVCKETVVKSKESIERKRSRKIDSVLTNKYLAIPLFVLIMFGIFYLTFNVIGAFLSDMLAYGIDYFTALVDSALTAYGINQVVHSLIIDGVFAGVGSVLSFLPLIVVLFFFLSVLEDTGYMARIAFVMDKLLRKIGLSGRSIVPMLIGFGCTVPAIMATRTLSSERDRKMTIMLTPFMSCSAKIPIYAVFAAAFFPKHSALVMIIMYLFGIVTGIVTALILNKTAFRGNPVPFVMELPNYRFPSFKSVMLLMWDKAKDFIERAFTIIFAGTIIIWFLQSFDIRLNVVTNSEESLLAMVAKLISPIFKPIGFENYKITTALLSGFTAKEAVVSTLSVLLGTTMANLPYALNGLFTTISAVSFLVFTLLYTPCVAAIATVKQELNSAKKAFFFAILQCIIAYIVSFLVYNLGMILL